MQGQARFIEAQGQTSNTTSQKALVNVNAVNWIDVHSERAGDERITIVYATGTPQQVDGQRAANLLRELERQGLCQTTPEVARGAGQGNQTQNQSFNR